MLDQPLSRRLREIRDAESAPAVLPELPPRLPLGQLLVSKGLLSEADLGLALAHQRQDGRPLGQILLGMGVITPQELARTLTEQHGFDFSASLRRRLAPVPERTPAAEPAEAPDGPPHDERYLVREPGAEEPLHVAESFLDAADAAFELIEVREPEQLEIVRMRDGDCEQLWSYRRDDAAGPATDTAA